LPVAAVAAFASARAAPACAAAENVPAIVSRVATEVENKYVDSTLARAMAGTIRQKLRRGAYRSISEVRVLCDTLNAELLRLSHDLHLRLVYSAEPLEVDSPGGANDAARDRDYMAQVLAEGKTRNFGFDQVSRLAGNLGYLRMSTFFPLEHGRAVADAAMQFLASTDAIIVDLRGNSGGSPDMVGYLASHFVTDTTVTGTRYDRITGYKTTRVAPVPGSAWFRGKPLYVLLDSTVFSAPEAFAYGLQSLGRVVVVGERTRGGAHLTSGWTIDPHVQIRIPHERGINARTGTDWEGTGVTPDIPAPSARALVAAQVVALRELMSRDSGASELGDERKAALARLQQTPAGSSLAR
jgi:hypothetical protein